MMLAGGDRKKKSRVQSKDYRKPEKFWVEAGLEGQNHIPFGKDTDEIEDVLKHMNNPQQSRKPSANLQNDVYKHK